MGNSNTADPTTCLSTSSTAIETRQRGPHAQHDSSPRSMVFAVCVLSLPVRRPTTSTETCWKSARLSLRSALVLQSSSTPSPKAHTKHSKESELKNYPSPLSSADCQSVSSTYTRSDMHRTNSNTGQQGRTFIQHATHGNRIIAATSQQAVAHTKS